MDDRVEKILQTIRHRYHETLSIDELAAGVNLSSSRLSFLFKRDVGSSIKQIQREVKLRVAASMLSRTHLPVSEVALRVGFNDAPHFTRVFREVTGFSPSEYRRMKEHRSDGRKGMHSTLTVAEA